MQLILVGTLLKELETRNLKAKPLKDENLQESTMNGNVYWVGIVKDAKEMHARIWAQLAQACCDYNITIHILVGSNKDYAERMREILYQSPKWQHRESQETCAPFIIDDEDNHTSKYEANNRIHRIAKIRDFQREKVRKLWTTNRPSSRDVIIVSDLDLERLPPVSEMMAQAKKISDGNSEDVICAAGFTAKSVQELWYYDTFSTILLPDTFVHPLNRRLIQKYYDLEDSRFVRSNNPFGSFTQGDLTNHLETIASESKTGNAPVRSCFGGLALYRATTWFVENCCYNSNTPKLDRYANAEEGWPCEHVIFHTCLQDTPNMTTRVAINPNLKTWWSRGEETNERIAHGISTH